MLLLDGYSDPEKDPGRWFPLERAIRSGEEFDPAAKENAGVPALRVRLIPDDVDDRFWTKYFGAKIKQVFKKGASIQSSERWKHTALANDKAAWALLDSANLEIRARDEGFAKILSDALGRDVKVGEAVCVDGHWTNELKKAVFNLRTKVRLFVFKHAGQLADEEDEAEEGKGAA